MDSGGTANAGEIFIAPLKISFGALQKWRCPVILCSIMAYTTDQSLLEAIRNGDGVSWEQFYDTYRPLILFCGKAHLNPAELDDLMQTVMLKVFQAGKHFSYDRTKGRFRDYLGRIIHNAIVDILRKRPRGEIHGEPPECAWDSFEAEWQEEWRKHLLTQAMEILKGRVTEKTFQAFDLYAGQGMDPRRVADFLRVDVTHVYKAKMRCSLMLRDLLAELQQEE